MRRRDVPRALLVSAAAGGTVVIADRVEAQTCTAPCYARSAAEISAGVTPSNTVYEPGNVLRYGTNTTPGVTDMWAALQAACTQCSQAGGAPVFVPAGTYLVTSTVSITSPAQAIRIIGAGMNIAVIVKNGDSDLFNFTASGIVQVPPMFLVEGLRIGCSTAMTVGAAFNFTDSGVIPSISMKDIFIINAGSEAVSKAWMSVALTRAEDRALFGLGAQ